MFLGMIAFCAAIGSLPCSNSSAGSLIPALFVDLAVLGEPATGDLLLLLGDLDAAMCWKYEFNRAAANGFGSFGLGFDAAVTPTLDIANLMRPAGFAGTRVLPLSADGLPPSAHVFVLEVESSHEDMSWGAHRAALKMTYVTSSCSAFLWVRYLIFVFVFFWRTQFLDLSS
jgi:hypothetical protein